MVSETGNPFYYVESEGLNPYFVGRWFRSPFYYVESEEGLCLNPYFVGRWFRSAINISEILKKCSVLILILLEDGFGDCSQPTNHGSPRVLILILLEDGFGEQKIN